MRPLSLLRVLATAFVLGAASLTQAAAPTAGDVPPDYLGRNLDRDPIHIDKYAGKPLVISFWATWCPYCLKELPVLSAIRKASKGAMQVVTINTEDRDTFRHATKVLKDLDLDLLYDPDRKAQANYQVTGLPHMLIIGRDGKIVRVFRGYDESSLPEIADAINRATGALQ